MVLDLLVGQGGGRHEGRLLEGLAMMQHWMDGEIADGGWWAAAATTTTTTCIIRGRLG